MMKQTEIFVAHSGRTVRGWYFLPEGEGPFPAAVLSHGYNGCREDFVPTARYLAELGIASVTYTFCGGSTRDDSGFPTTSMSLFTQREDLLAVLDWLKAQPHTDPERVFLFGGSQGGMVSVLAAAERPGAARGAMLLFPALCIADNWRERFPNGEDIPEQVEFWGMTLGRFFFMDMRQLDVFSLLPRLELPVRIAQGDLDPIATLDYSRRALELLPRADLHVFLEEAHGFTPPAQQEVDRLLGEFILSSGALDPGKVYTHPKKQ